MHFIKKEKIVSGMVNYTPQDLLEILLEMGSSGQLAPPEPRPQGTQESQGETVKQTKLVFYDNLGIICWYSLELPRQSDSNENPQHMSQLMRLWHFLSSVNSFFKWAAIQWS